MRCQSGLCPLVEDALGRAGDELLRAVANQAHDLRATFVIEAPGRKNLRDLFAELAVALQ
jgi:hypothetical protein